MEKKKNTNNFVETERLPGMWHPVQCSSQLSLA